MAKTKRKIKPIYSLLLLLVVLALCAGVFVLARRNTPDKANTNDGDAKTDSTVPSAQEDFTEGGDREPGNTESENNSSGGISDNGGSIDSSIDTGNPLVSKGGEISLYTPRQNATVKSGQLVAGESSLSKVNYRLIDNVSGVVSTGELSVVNGKFSGTLEFATSATEGRLDIFATRNDGSEYATIEVPLRFK